jgi:hypothetical protein
MSVVSEHVYRRRSPGGDLLTLMKQIWHTDKGAPCQERKLWQGAPLCREGSPRHV